MGNDGGSIAKRDDLVKTKGRGEQIDKKNQLLAAWFMCALSKKELAPPVVACPLGRMFNKDALLEFLISPPSSEVPVSATPFGADGLATAGHIRSLKDVVQLQLTPNVDRTASKQGAQAGAEIEFQTAKFVCPITQREMNGSTRFVYLKHCGSVVSEAALKQLRAPEKRSKTAAGPVILEKCSICGADYAPNEPELGILINPSSKEDIERMKADWEETKLREKEAKRANKKRKHNVENGDNDMAAGKKPKKALNDAGNTKQSNHNGAPRLPTAIAAALEAKKAHIATTAVASLYAKDDPNKKEDWMVRGTMRSRV